MSARVLTTVALALALGGCSKQHPASSGAGPRILRHIPADTPYVIASVEPFSRSYLEAYVADNARKVRKAIEDLRKQDLGPAGAALIAFLEELSADPTLAGYEKLGFAAGGRAAFYAIGLLPAMRVEVRDAALLAATMERAMTKGGVQILVETHRGRKMWVYRVVPEVTIAWGFSDGELVAAVAPTALVPRTLDVLFGETALGPSLASSGGLEKLAAQHGYMRQLVGWIDLSLAAAAATSEGASMARDQLAAFGAPPLSPMCREELHRLTALAPRWAFGATELTPARSGGSLLMELDPLLAGELRALRTPVPGLGAPLHGGVFSFGLALDVGKLLGALRRGARFVLAVPYHCEALTWMNEAARELDRGLGEEIPPWVKELRGVVVALDSIEPGLAFPSFKAYGLIAASDPIQLIDLAKRTISSLAGMQIPADGRPVPIPGGVLPLMTGHIAMKGQLLGLSIGSGAELLLTRLMSSPPLSSQPVIAVAVDGEKMKGLMEILQSTLGSKDGAADFGAGVTQLTVELTDRGIVWRGSQVSTGR